MEGRSIRCWALAAVLLAQMAGPAAARSSNADQRLDAAQAMIDSGRPDEALRLLEGAASGGAEARVLLLRSTARFMLGEIELGRRDLEASLTRDPELRQGWLNRAALDISEGKLDQALVALDRARALDPAALDTSLNIGAVLIMQERVEEARPHFERYLSANGDSPEAWYLVATNYAMADRAPLAIEHLTRAIALDERMRLRVRTDANFASLAGDAAFRQTLDTDSYRIPAGSHAIYQTYEAPYLAGEGKLLPAVLDALQLSGEPFDHRIEVAPDWALIWGELRIKVRNDTHQGGRVELTAPRDRFTAAEWKARANRLFAEITVQLAKR